MSLKDWIKRGLRSRGYDIVKTHRTFSYPQRREMLMESLGIDLVLDVGADVGEYGRELRAYGYRGRIVSFEPRQAAFAQLKVAAQDDGAWEARNMALGREQGRAAINVAKNAYSSSFLPMMQAHLEAEPEARYVGTEEVEIATVDGLLPQIRGAARRVLLKIDTQGFELPVIQGAEASLPSIAAVQVELSLRPLYENETLFAEMLGVLGAFGLRLRLLEAGIHDPRTGETLQVDAVFAGAAGGHG